MDVLSWDQKGPLAVKGDQGRHHLGQPHYPAVSSCSPNLPFCDLELLELLTHPRRHVDRRGLLLSPVEI